MLFDMLSGKESAVDNTPESTKPRWGQARRLAFIDLRLQYDGRINRSDIQDFFQISTPQATADLELYRRVAGSNLRYDGRQKAYVAEPGFVPHFGHQTADRYLDELFRLESALLSADESFVGYRPSVGVVATPSRAIDAPTVAILVRAMRDGTALDISYDSMNSATPADRVISPHAMGFDGLRWHVRAWCHTRRVFRDFAIGRLRIRGEADVDVTPDAIEDTGWTTTVVLRLEPHPGLTEHQREAIVRDFGMENGQCEVKCRKAMVFYTLRHLNLERDEIAVDPVFQHVVLVNRAEVNRWMEEDRALAPAP